MAERGRVRGRITTTIGGTIKKTITVTITMGENKKSLPDLAAKQGPNGGWEFAKLSFPC